MQYYCCTKRDDQGREKENSFWTKKTDFGTETYFTVQSMFRLATFLRWFAVLHPARHSWLWCSLGTCYIPLPELILSGDDLSEGSNNNNLATFAFGEWFYLIEGAHLISETPQMMIIVDQQRFISWTWTWDWELEVLLHLFPRYATVNITGCCCSVGSLIDITPSPLVSSSACCDYNLQIILSISNRLEGDELTFFGG